MTNWFRRRFAKSSDIQPAATDSSPEAIYSNLRHRALSVRRTDIYLPEPPPDNPVWGLLMETGHSMATVTLFALSDGTTSLYLSSGGGIIGGQGYKSVRDASTAFIETANRYYQLLAACESFPVPETGQTLFYALTDSGILMGQGLENDLGYNRHSLSPLFYAGQGVITQLRLMSESTNQPPR